MVVDCRQADGGITETAEGLRTPTALAEHMLMQMLAQPLPPELMHSPCRHVGIACTETPSFSSAFSNFGPAACSVSTNTLGFCSTSAEVLNLVSIQNRLPMDTGCERETLSMMSDYHKSFDEPCGREDGEARQACRHLAGLEPTSGKITRQYHRPWVWEMQAQRLMTMAVNSPGCSKLSQRLSIQMEVS